MKKYTLYGRSGAGSLIVEFLLTQANIAYDVEYPDDETRKSDAFRALNPLGRIPVLITPEGHAIYETMAIVYHLVDRHDGLAPAASTAERDRFNQFLALMATSIYPGYHRQHHNYQYGGTDSLDDIRQTAKAFNYRLFDYLETELSPYICGKTLSAADFYLYMLHRWDTDKTALREGRPNLTHFLEVMRAHPVVEQVLASQPPRK